MEKFKCICCEKEIESIWFDGVEAENPEQGAWNNGVVEKIHMGYGSRFDEDIYVFGICDDCIEEKHKKGLIGKRIYKKED